MKLFLIQLLVSSLVSIVKNSAVQVSAIRQPKSEGLSSQWELSQEIASVFSQLRNQNRSHDENVKLALSMVLMGLVILKLTKAESYFQMLQTIKYSKYFQQPYHNNNYNNSIQQGFDGTLHWNVCVHEPKNNSGYNENDDDC